MTTVTAAVASNSIDVRSVSSPPSTGVVKRKPVLHSGNLALRFASTSFQSPSVSCVAEQEGVGGLKIFKEEETPQSYLPAFRLR